MATMAGQLGPGILCQRVELDSNCHSRAGFGNSERWKPLVLAHAFYESTGNPAGANRHGYELGAGSGWQSRFHAVEERRKPVEMGNQLLLFLPDKFASGVERAAFPHRFRNGLDGSIPVRLAGLC